MLKQYSRVFALNFILIIFILIIIEIGLRLTNHQAGNLTPNWSNFKPVDSLVEYHHFITDSNGLIVANRYYFESQHININQDGFRTPEWNTIDSSKKTLLFIGDSFTWGLSANPITNCFADLLRTESPDNIVNLGIPVADPAQYALLANKYIPKLKPEHVFVMFYLGNDIMLNDRKIKPLQPLYFYTNAGALQTTDGNRTFSSAVEAYEYYVSEKYFLKHPTTLTQKMVAKSALLSLVYSLKLRWSEKQNFNVSIQKMIHTKKYLHQIAQCCKENQCQLHIILIPERKEADVKIDDLTYSYKTLFTDSIIGPNVMLPSSMSKAFYTEYPDAHLNNNGHKFYAKYLLKLLKGCSR